MRNHAACLVGFGAARIALLSFWPLVTIAQEAAPSAVIAAPRPLADAADRLQMRFATPVTYEDPVWQWRGDLIQKSRTLLPRSRRLDLTAVLPPSRAKRLDLGMVDAVLAAYLRQNPDGPTFRAQRTKFGIHIIPSEATDSGGRPAPAITPLNLVVSVPEGWRTATQHLDALGRAVTHAAGLRVHSNVGLDGMRFDEAFAGLQATRFTWGIQGKPAREALTDLLDRSATSRSWRFFCQPGARQEDRFCVLNITPILVSATDRTGKPVTKALVYDRCKKCPPLFPPPAE